MTGVRFLAINLALLSLLACSDVSKDVCVSVGTPPEQFFVYHEYVESHFKTSNGSAFWINVLYPSGLPAQSSNVRNAIPILVRGLKSGQASHAEYSYQQRNTSRKLEELVYEMGHDGNVIIYDGPISDAKRRNARRRLSETVELTYILPDELYRERRKVDAAVVKLVLSMRTKCTPGQWNLYR